MKLLITGSNGLLGQKLLEALEKYPEFETLAVSRGSNRASDGPYAYESLDITDAARVRTIVDSYKPDVLIHTAAMTLVDLCEQNPEECRKVNVEGTRHLAEAASLIGCHFIHLSTDFVFDGKAGPYREEDLPNPLSVYGKSKWESEKMVMENSGLWTVIRTILVFGIVRNKSRSNIVLRVKESLENRRPLRMVTDQIRMPTLAEDLAAACLAAAKKKTAGIFHISGPEMLSIYDFALKTAQAFKLDASLISPVLTQDLREPAKRPAKTGFVLDKAVRELGYHPTPLKEALAWIAQSDIMPQHKSEGSHAED